MMRTTAVILATCLLAASAHADGPLKAGERVSMGVACKNADDALEVGASIDRNLENTYDEIHDKVVDGRCIALVATLRREDAVLVKIVLSAEQTDVWEVRTDAGGTFYVPFDREPAL